MLDGSGKSTMCTKLKHYLGNYNVIETSFLGKTIGVDSTRMAMNFLKKSNQRLASTPFLPISGKMPGGWVKFLTKKQKNIFKYALNTYAIDSIHL